MTYDQKAWLGVAKIRKPTDLDTLLPLLFDAKIAEVAPRIAALAKFKPDPRIARALTDALCTPPFSSLGSKVLWTPLFALITTIGDADSLDRLAPLVPRYDLIIGAATMGAWMKDKLAALVKALELRLGPAKPVARPATKPGTKTSSTSLLDDILQNPDDDAPRAVLSDLLLQKEDPRGEFIALQLRRAGGEPGDVARETALLAKHRDAWLGPLRDVVDVETAIWQRGFLDYVFVTGTPGNKVAKTAGDPVWGTVREIQCVSSRTAPLAVITHPIMRALRKVTELDAKGFLALATGTPLGIRELQAHWNSGFPAKLPRDVAVAFGDAPGLPELVRLDIGYIDLTTDPFERFDVFWSGALARRLQWFGFETYRTGEWITHLVRRRLTHPPRVQVTHDYELTASKPGGPLDRLAIRQAGPDPLIAGHVAEVLGEIPPKLVAITCELPAMPAHRKKIEKALARHETAARKPRI